jgi:hypothetical protein
VYKILSKKKGNQIGIKLVRCIFLVLNKCTKYCQKKGISVQNIVKKRKKYGISVQNIVKKKRQHDSDAFF